MVGVGRNMHSVRITAVLAVAAAVALVVYLVSPVAPALFAVFTWGTVAAGGLAQVLVSRD